MSDHSNHPEPDQPCDQLSDRIFTDPSNSSQRELQEALERQARRLDSMLQVGQALSTITRLEPLLKMVADEACRMMDARLCSILLVSDDSEDLELQALSGDISTGDDAPAPDRRIIPINKSLTGLALRKADILVVEDVQKEPLYCQLKMAQLLNLHSLLAVPIIYDDTVIGVINVYGQPDSRPRSERDRMLLKSFASQSAVAISSARRLEQIIETENMLRHSDRMALLGMMSAELAHEVRNPITVIQMLLHAMKEDATIGPGARSDLDMVLGKLQEIERIVARTLDLASSSDDEAAPFSLSDVAEDVIQLLHHRLKEQRIIVERDYVLQMAPVMGSRDQIQQVLLNLLLNTMTALRKNEEEGRDRRVRISLRETSFNGQAGVTAGVRDNGPGISDELAARALEPFVTGQKKGTGLGLYISNKIILKHLGHMRIANNEDGPGCTLTFWLPIHVHGGVQNN